MTKSLDESEIRLLKQIIEDLITIYDLKGRNMLLLLKDRNTGEYHFFSNKSDWKTEFVKDRLKHDLKISKPVIITADGKSQTDKGYYIDYSDELDGTEEGFGTFGAIFILNLGRHLSQKEIPNAVLLLKGDGILFHLEKFYLSSKIYEPYLFTRYDDCEAKDGRKFSLLTSFKKSETSMKHNNFFQNPDWYKKLNLKLHWEIREDK